MAAPGYNLDHHVGERLPSHPVVRARFATAHRQRRVQKQDPSACPGFEAPVTRRRHAATILQFLLDVHEGRWAPDPLDTEKQRPSAWPAPWYGSCPTITTFV
jgi:hypothetical protein